MKLAWALLLLLLPSLAHSLPDFEQSSYIMDQSPYPFFPLDKDRNQTTLGATHKQAYGRNTGSTAMIRGGTFRVTRGITDKIGVGLHAGLGFGFKKSRTSSTYDREDFRTMPLGSHMVYDVVQRRSFRMPLFFAYTQNFLSGEFNERDYSADRRTTGSFTGTSPQISFGVTPQMRSGPFRLALSCVFLKNLGASFKTESEQTVLSSGAPLAYGVGRASPSSDTLTPLLGFDIGLVDYGLVLGWSHLSLANGPQALGNALLHLDWNVDF
jgi:hypothetical protein